MSSVIGVILVTIVYVICMPVLSSSGIASDCLLLSIDFIGSDSAFNGGSYFGWNCCIT